jgi:hypothetical protein
VQAAIAEPAERRWLQHPFPDAGIVVPLPAIPNRHPIHSQHIER